MSDDSAQVPSGPLNTQALQSLLTFRISRVNARLNAQASQILKQHGGLSQVQWRLLASINALGTTTSQQICRTTAMDKGLVSRKLKDLVSGGFVQSRVNQNDNRQQMLTLTDKGLETFEAVQPVMLKRRVYLMEQLTTEEADTLSRALSKLDASAERLDF